MAYFNKTAFSEDLMAQCKGKTECIAQMNQSYFMPPRDSELFKDFEKQYRYLFAQVACQSSDEELMSKNLWGLGIACLSLLIMLLFREYANYIYEMDVYNSQLLDMKLITVDDYTCSGWIKKKTWEKHN